MNISGTTHSVSAFDRRELLTDINAVKEAFDENGYVIIRGLLDNEELHKLRASLSLENGLMSQTYSKSDDGGGRARISIWSHPGDDVTGRIARSEKVAGTMEQLLEGEVYHYHSKVIMKDARTGGSWVWHQDYGYSYYNGLLRPDLATVWIAVDEANRENGCLQLLAGSHKAGRVEHVWIGEQAGADPERVELCRRVYPHCYAECLAGDAIFFHCNLLHTSAQNRSERRRWAFLTMFNRADNDPVIRHHFPQYTPLSKVPNSAIKECPRDLDLSGKGFFGVNKEDVTCKDTTFRHMRRLEVNES